VDAAGLHGVRVNRVSQGSGAMLLTRQELADMASIGREQAIDVCLFVGPRGSYGTGALAHSPAGESLAWAVCGEDQLAAAVRDVERAIEQGITSFLIADIGLLVRLRRRQGEGQIPANIAWKISAAVPATNSETIAVLESLGATTINVPADTSLVDLEAYRSAVNIPLDLYIEAPDSMGGMIRLDALTELVAAGAPLYAKFGLSNAASVYPAGTHLASTVEAQAREKVRRAAIALEIADSRVLQSAGHSPFVSVGGE
jgi:hypothetical protein